MNKVLLFLFVLVALISCSKDDKNKMLLGEWDLISYSGGISGVSCQFDEGVIVWTFSDDDLIIQNKPTLFDDCAPSISVDTFTYSTIENDRGIFLLVSDAERGALTFTETGFMLNPNRYSDADLADAPMWIFE